MAVLNAKDFFHKPWPKNAYYIGRNPKIWAQSGQSGSPKYGNPFVMKDQSEIERTRVIAAYGAYLEKQLENPRFKADMIKDLKDQDLVCHCAPKGCHGDVLQHAVAQISAGKSWKMPTQHVSPTKTGPDTRLVAQALDRGLPKILSDDPSPEARALQAAYKDLTLLMRQAGRLKKTDQGFTVDATSPVSPQLLTSAARTQTLQTAMKDALKGQDSALAKALWQEDEPASKPRPAKGFERD